jgi:hypothetical protein
MTDRIISQLPTTSYYSECECGQVVEGEGQYDPADGTLYGQDCPSCGEEFTVLGWFEECDYCNECHEEKECGE